jgi:hypothetical protein
MTYRGTVQNGVVVLADGAKLAEGVEVRIEVAARISEENVISEVNGATLYDHLKEFIGCIEGPSDMAENHDHYLYGLPKK